MELKDFFKEVGGDYEKVLLRLPDQNMVKKFVCKFVDDASYTELKNALERKDVPSAFRAAHTLKGIAANLGLDALAKAASELTEQLRGMNDMPAEGYVEAVDRTYRLTIEKIAQITF